MCVILPAAAGRDSGKGRNTYCTPAGLKPFSPERAPYNSEAVEPLAKEVAFQQSPERVPYHSEAVQPLAQEIGFQQSPERAPYNSEAVQPLAKRVRISTKITKITSITEILPAAAGTVQTKDAVRITRLVTSYQYFHLYENFNV
jgi:hypothetical protein